VVGKEIYQDSSQTQVLTKQATVLTFCTTSPTCDETLDAMFVIDKVTRLGHANHINILKKKKLWTSIIIYYIYIILFFLRVLIVHKCKYVAEFN
jgi:hypothetical protein